jgi:hypothetical protein
VTHRRERKLEQQMCGLDEHAGRPEMGAQHESPLGGPSRRIRAADLQDAHRRRHAAGNDPEAQATALLALLLRPHDEAREPGERRRRRRHIRGDGGIGEQREQRMSIRHVDLAQGGHLAAQRRQLFAPWCGHR